MDGLKSLPKGIFSTGLFAPEALARVAEMRKTWKYVPYNKVTFKMIRYEDQTKVSVRTQHQDEGHPEDVAGSLGEDSKGTP